jgi:hypothetical protein
MHYSKNQLFLQADGLVIYGKIDQNIFNALRARMRGGSFPAPRILDDCK